VTRKLVTIDRLAGIRQAPLARFGTVEAIVRDRGTEPFTIQIRGRDIEADAGTDSALLRRGWVTVTPLLGVRADDNVDVAGDIERAISRAA